MNHHQHSSSGQIALDELAGGIDLQLTLASGQSYRWRRRDGRLFEAPAGHPTPWYETVADGTVICIRQHDDHLEYFGSDGVKEHVESLLRLDDDLSSILEAGPDEPIYREAVATHRGMRLVRDSLYVSLISFICSTQMHVERIHQMVQSLMSEVGTTHHLDGRAYHAFPTPTELAACATATLRGCGLGYRAPYVKRTADRIVKGGIPADATDGPYEQRREALTVFHGVGPKVADCALLFGAGELEAVPLDRWIQRAISAYFPDCDGDDYAATSRLIRERLGPYPGYAQTYLFHYLRTNGGLEDASATGGN